MSRSFQRDLALLDIPAGDLGAFKKEGGKIKLYDMGGGSSQPAQSTTQTQDLPDWAKGYAQDVLAKGQALTDTSQNPYQAYGGQRQAGFTDLQKTAMANVASPEAWGKNVEGYMSPYMENVVKQQQRNATEQAGIQAGALNAKAAQMGAFGGSGVALQRAAQGRDLQRQLGDIQATGLQNAFQQGTQQANTALGQQMQLGGLQQQQAQQGLDTAYQDFLAQKNYPYQQLSYMSNLIRGTPMGMNTQSQVYQGTGQTLGQLAGLGMMGYGMSKMAGGGEVQSFDNGGLSVIDKFNDPSAMMPDLADMSIEQLQAIVKAPATKAEGEAAQQVLQAKLAEDASMQQGLGAAFEQVPYSNRQRIVRAAGGGILAFKDEGLVPKASWEYDLEDMVNPEDVQSRPDDGSAWGALKRGFLYNSDVAAKEKAADAARDDARALTEFDRATDDYMTARADKAKAANKGISAAVGKSGPRASGITASPAGASTTPTAGGANTFEENYRTAQRLTYDPEAAADRKALNAMIAQQGKRAGDLKQQAMADFLMQYGAGVAQAAAKPGSTFLGSLSGGAPAGISALMANRKAVAAAQDANLKMQIEQRKYDIAERKNDRTAMISAAHNMQMLSQQQAQLGEMIRHNKASEGIAATRASAGAGLQKAYMAGMSKAQDRASREATKLWSDPLERSDLKKRGINTYDQLLQLRMKQHMKAAVPIYGVTAEDDDNEG